VPVKRFLLLLGVIVLAAMAALAITFLPQTLAVSPGPPITAPAPSVPAGVRVKAVLTGKLYVRAALAFRGGSFADERVFGVGSILVEHPSGLVLFDAGFGRNVEAHLATTSWLIRQTTRIGKERTVAEQLAAAGISPHSLKGVILTHAHWDHVSGLDDLRGVALWVNKEELEFIQSGVALTALARQIGTQDYRVYEFSGGPYLGFAKSHDFFGDGSIILVPAPGHTPGSIFAFITTSSGERYVLVGDTAWQIEGVELPAERPWLSRSLVDSDAGKVRGLLVRLHTLKKAMPGLTVVPAHDRRIWERLPGLTP
jgi:glyoxylase-like metal-dependent hydrolase (beta-lactamase superfamily II)